MANRYWVGGNGTWNSINVTNWSTTSGGSGGASVPTSADSVFFDDNSFATDTLNITVSGTVNCSSFTNGRTGTKSLVMSGDFSAVFNVYGTDFYTGLSGRGNFSAVQSSITFHNTSNCTISGYAAIRSIRVNVAARVTLNLTGSPPIEHILALGNSSITLRSDTKVSTLVGTNSTGQSIPQITVGTNSFPATLYIEGGTSCLNGGMTITNATAATCKTVLTGFYGNPTLEIYTTSTISRLEIDPAVGGRSFTLGGPVSIGTLSRATSSLAFTLKFKTSGGMVSISNFNIEGDASTTINVESSVPGVRAKVTKVGGGTVVTNYMQVKDMQPYPDNTWISYNSTDSGNNWQWYFDEFKKPTSSLFFGNHL